MKAGRFCLTGIYRQNTHQNAEPDILSKYERHKTTRLKKPYPYLTRHTLVVYTFRSNV